MNPNKKRTKISDVLVFDDESDWPVVEATTEKRPNLRQVGAKKRREKDRQDE